MDGELCSWWDGMDYVRKVCGRWYVCTILRGVGEVVVFNNVQYLLQAIHRVLGVVRESVLKALLGVTNKAHT